METLYVIVGFIFIFLYFCRVWMIHKKYLSPDKKKGKQ